jgi:hypothetical protein
MYNFGFKWVIGYVVYCQNDEAYPLFSRNITQYMNEQFADQLIKCSGMQNWPLCG